MRRRRPPFIRRPWTRILLWTAYAVELGSAALLARFHAVGPAVATASLATALTLRTWWDRDLWRI